MEPEPTDTPWAARDLLAVLDVGMARGAHLLTEAERTTVAQLQALDPALLDSFARLQVRRHGIQRRADCLLVDDLGAAGLLDDEVPPSQWLPRATVAELSTVLAQHGQRVRRGSRRSLLLQRAIQLPVAPCRTWVHLRHRPLILRLRRFAALRPFPDPSNPLLQRLGVRSWPAYPLTPGAALWLDRPHLLGWEHVAERLCTELEPDEALQLLEDPHAIAPGRLDLRPRLRRALLHGAEARERVDPGTARDLYQVLAMTDGRHAERARLRLAHLTEREGDPEGALQLLRDAHRHSRGPARLAFHRTGRRLAQRCRQGWAPDPPHAPPRGRRIELEPCPIPDANRPHFQPGLPVEAATIHLLAEHGRTALHAEGTLWRHVFALLLAPRCYFEPVPGMLPTRFLDGPLDLGTPGFAERRAEAVAATRALVLAGDAPLLARETHARFGGARLAHARWERTVDEDCALVAAIGPHLLWTIVQALLDHGPRRASGLPDLLILPGPPIELPRSHPRRLGANALLAELKTPKDTVSDAQRWWLQQLSSKAHIELWQVHPARGRHTQER